MSKIKISSVGVELEGGVDSLEKIRKVKNLVRDYSETTDGSVFVKKYYSDLELRFWVKREELNNLFNAIDIIFGEGFTQNNSCGNHIHFKFSNKDEDVTKEVVNLFSFKMIQCEFIKEYIKYANTRENKEKYLNRLNNKYCLGAYNRYVVIYQLVNDSKGDYRYRAINLNSFNIHGTLEFRILPYVVGAKEYKENLIWLINTVEKLIKKYNNDGCLLHRFNIKTNINLPKLDVIKVKIDGVKKVCVI